ncbi:hypothetical protein N7486_003961 [Penicillium sp. IBT 16267x]|nr:hypothetical protein N7486_003961 [Penicillium sp. IBT 16267x]
MLDITQSLRQLNTLRQTYEGNGRAMWLIGQDLSVGQRSDIGDCMAGRPTSLDEFWKRTTPKDHNQVENVLRLMDGLGNLDCATAYLTNDSVKVHRKLQRNMLLWVQGSYVT